MARTHIKAGDLRHVVEVQKPVKVQSDKGDITQSWERVTLAYAAVHPFSSRELVAAQAIHHEASIRLIVRHNPTITSDCRILWKGRVLTIHGVQEDMDSTIEYMTLTCSQGVNDTGA